MTVWMSVRKSPVRHGYRNDTEGAPSLCGRSKHPGIAATDRPLPYCRWCSDKARPPDAPNTGGMHAKGSPWAHQKQWVKTGSKRNQDYYH